MTNTAAWLLVVFVGIIAACALLGVGGPWRRG
jgi:hypothetical protein